MISLGPPSPSISQTLMMQGSRSSGLSIEHLTTYLKPRGSGVARTTSLRTGCSINADINTEPFERLKPKAWKKRAFDAPLT